MEDKGLIRIAPRVDEQDPYAKEQILPTDAMKLNPEQERAMVAIRSAMEQASVVGDGVGEPQSS